MRSRLIKALNNRFYVKFMELEIGLLFVSYFQSEVECWKQTNNICFFNFGEDLSYFVILRYKLRDFIKNL